MRFLNRVGFHQCRWTERLKRMVFKELSTDVVFDVINRWQFNGMRPKAFRSRRLQIVSGPGRRWFRRKCGGRIVEDGLKPCGLLLNIISKHKSGDLLVNLCRDPSSNHSVNAYSFNVALNHETSLSFVSNNNKYQLLGKITAKITVKI
jgi:hypothetical protein